MSVLSLKDASYQAHVQLFQSLTYSFGREDRVGLVALNGAGKSTFLKCLTGELEFTSGEVTFSRGARIGYMSQEVEASLLDLTCRAAITSALPEPQRVDESWRVDMVLGSLGFEEAQYEQTVATLSGGWQRLLLLARIWVTEPDILLMDEPTNHLDLEKILFLENWLLTWAAHMPVIIASHDRSFLDAVTNRTLFLRPGQSQYFSLPYTRAKQELERVDAALALERERRLGEAEQLRKQSAKLKNIGLNSGSDLLQKKQKQLRERAERIEEKVEELHAERAGEIRLATGGTHAKVLVRVENLEVATPDGRLLFKVPALDIAQGDRLVLLGHNGCGKSTFVRLLRRALVAGEEIPGIRVTPSLNTGYLDQALSDVPPDVSSFEHVAHRGESDARCHAALASAGISFDWQTKPMRLLSWGQRARVALLALRFEAPNFYLLDEPTNHVDIAGQEMLADEIKSRGAGSVLVTHDRTFARETGNRFLVIEGGKLSESASPESYFASVAAEI
ncbi:MAG: ABC-F family ATP-binding cassette domain-containing protein [Alphaproteobacteria bacterium]|nr:MAG: ABC-F family ATP-binding cassette domain-containing protein [Alphaproteobacteria bacterium]